MTTTSATAPAAAIRSTIPARIDRLPWSPFHTRMVVALGVAWVLDGLEITVASAEAGKLSDPSTLNMSAAQIAFALGTVYLLGEVVGALLFGKLSDRLGRKKLFLLTLGLYLLGNGLTALTFGSGNAWAYYFYATRFVAGMGIGGEYAAINSAIDELIPARYRGRVDIAVNGTYWGGALIGTLGTFYFLNNFSNGSGWRFGFILGPVLGVVILFVRRSLPESPRWQVMNGREREANESIDFIEREVEAKGAKLERVDDSQAIEITPTTEHGYVALLGVLFRLYPKRAILAASMMITQSFLYNAIFFTYALVLKSFYNVDPNQAPIYFIAFAIGNLAGPLTIGRLFDTVGRRKMIAGTYILSGVLLAISAFMFNAGILNATTQTIAWAIIFFFASAGASSAYLTVSEIFPLEVRAKAIAVFFAIAQCVGAFGPWFFGKLIGKGEQTGPLMAGYLIGAGVMIFGGVIAAFLAVDAEGRSLEDIAAPLSAVKQRGPSETMTGLTGTVRDGAGTTARNVDLRSPDDVRGRDRFTDRS
ncbi:MAG: arabinose efflux permease family protein [Frankiales bacterium]|nr:arabinose efflux permease family protein [Frankiales bacterium]